MIIVYSHTAESTVRDSLGSPEYSYYFVLKAFRPVLERLDQVVSVRSPEREVDAIYRSCRARGEPCVFLSFTPPHKTLTTLECPTLPVFAWEFEGIPSDTWFGDARNDWRWVFRTLGAAITHSDHTVDVVRQAIGPDFPILSAPAPLWDGMARHYRPGGLRNPRGPARIEAPGIVIDSRTLDLKPGAPPWEGSLAEVSVAGRVEIEGVVYGSVFNPWDGRKNWIDMLTGFCVGFRDVEDATLLLKITHTKAAELIPTMIDAMARFAPFRCRVLIVESFLEDADYARLVEVTTYGVNTSHGEGQCLPLMEFMSVGKPALAPPVTAMSDYVNTSNAFTLGASLEPSAWPHDPRFALKAMRYRLDWESLVAAYRESYRVAKSDPARYAAMSTAAHEALRRHCSSDVIAAKLRPFLAARAADRSRAGLEAVGA